VMAPCSSRVPVVRNPLMPVPINAVKVRRIVHGELIAPALSPVGIENREIPWVVELQRLAVTICISLRCTPLVVRAVYACDPFPPAITMRVELTVKEECSLLFVLSLSDLD